MARIFVSYKHHAEPDEWLANYFVHALQQLGHRIFIDRRIAIGDEWPAVIQAELQAADYLLLLLSSESAVSDMVIQEVKIARDVRRRRLAQKKSGRPMILLLAQSSGNRSALAQAQSRIVVLDRGVYVHRRPEPIAVQRW
jgi:hypothetical protein